MNAADRQLVITSIFDAFGEDYDQMGRLVHHLMINLPDEDWPTVLAAFADQYQPFIDSGLSIDWWVQTVIEIAESMGG